jgi:hypothetical protein
MRYNHNHWTLPLGSKLWRDTGFRSHEPVDVQTFQPAKKPRGRDLSPEERLTNATRPKDRIGVEHSLDGVKVFRIVRDAFRNLRLDFDDLVREIACGLHNLGVDYPLMTSSRKAAVRNPPLLSHPAVTQKL